MASYHPSNIPTNTPTTFPSQIPSIQPYPYPTIQSYQEKNSLPYYIYFTFLIICIFTMMCVLKICYQKTNDRKVCIKEYCQQSEGIIEIELKDIQLDDTNMVNKNHNIKFNIT